VELPDAVLHHPIRHRHALVLAQVLDPRLDQENLDVPSRLARIAEDIPLDRAVSTPHLGELANGRDERIGLGRIDAVLDLDEHRTFIGPGDDVDVRLWPVHRRCEVKRAGSIERPAPDRGESQDEACGRHGERLGRAKILGNHPPRGAAGPEAANSLELSKNTSTVSSPIWKLA
jgi:hypothetical protein